MQEFEQQIVAFLKELKRLGDDLCLEKQKQIIDKQFFLLSDSLMMKVPISVLRNSDHRYDDWGGYCYEVTS